MITKIEPYWLLEFTSDGFILHNDRDITIGSLYIKSTLDNLGKFLKEFLQHSFPLVKDSKTFSSTQEADAYFDNLGYECVDCRAEEFSDPLGMRKYYKLNDIVKSISYRQCDNGAYLDLPMCININKD